MININKYYLIVIILFIINCKVGTSDIAEEKELLDNKFGKSLDFILDDLENDIQQEKEQKEGAQVVKKEENEADILLEESIKISSTLEELSEEKNLTTEQVGISELLEDQEKIAYEKIIMALFKKVNEEAILAQNLSNKAEVASIVAYQIASKEIGKIYMRPTLNSGYTLQMARIAIRELSQAIKVALIAATNAANAALYAKKIEFSISNESTVKALQRIAMSLKGSAKVLPKIAITRIGKPVVTAIMNLSEKVAITLEKVSKALSASNQADELAIMETLKAVNAAGKAANEAAKTANREKKELNRNLKTLENMGQKGLEKAIETVFGETGKKIVMALQVGIESLAKLISNKVKDSIKEERKNEIRTILNEIKNNRIY